MKKESRTMLVVSVIIVIVLLILVGVLQYRGIQNNETKRSPSKPKNVVTEFEERVSMSAKKLMEDIVNKTVTKENFLATSGENSDGEFYNIVQGVEKEYATTAIDVKKEGKDFSIKDDGYTIAYYLDKEGTNFGEGEGYIIFFYASNKLKSIIDLDSAKEKYGLDSFMNNDIDIDSIVLVAIIKLENYNVKLSNFGISTTEFTQSDIKNNGEFSKTSLKDKVLFKDVDYDNKLNVGLFDEETNKIKLPWNKLLSEYLVYLMDGKVVTNFETLPNYNNLSNYDLIGYLVLPENITTIGEKAFGALTNLNSITIPKSVKRIEESAFMGYTGVIKYDGTMAEWDDISKSESWAVNAPNKVFCKDGEIDTIEK